MVRHGSGRSSTTVPYVTRFQSLFIRAIWGADKIPAEVNAGTVEVYAVIRGLLEVKIV